jgi:hypothetical protein
MSTVPRCRRIGAAVLFTVMAAPPIGTAVEHRNVDPASATGATAGRHQELPVAGFEAAASDPPVAPAPTETKGPWIGPDGKVLAFRTGDEVKEFLAAAKVLSITDVGLGVTNPKKLLLERDGVRIHAIFRYEHVVQDQLRLRDRTFHMFFKDSYLGEPAAFELARLLGMNTVPPAITRSLPRLGDGSIQLWMENAMTELDRRKRNIRPPDVRHFTRQMHNMIVFDNLVNNIDRNLGNILIGPDWKIWYIDCTRCFARSRDLPKPDRVRWIERRFWERLQDLDWDEVRRRLSPNITSFEFRALRERHGKLVDLINQRIGELGEESVLFSFEDDRTLETPEIPEFPPDSPEPIDPVPDRIGLSVPPLAESVLSQAPRVRPPGDRWPLTRAQSAAKQ